MIEVLKELKSRFCRRKCLHVHTFAANVDSKMEKPFAEKLTSELLKRSWKGSNIPKDLLKVQELQSILNVASDTELKVIYFLPSH